MRNKEKTWIVISILLGVGIYWSCKDEITGGGPSTVVFPDSGVKYGIHVEPLFLQSCAFSGCHGEDTYATMGFSLDTYEHATARAGIIVPCRQNEPCNPENSILIQRIEGLNGLEQMPKYGPPLNSNQINGMKTWIREGAQNN